MMSQLENNTTDLQAVLDCVDELNVSASEAADKMEINTTDLQSILDAVNALPDASNTEIGASYNADGTQNLIIKDDGSVIEIPDPNPVLLWTNASPTSAFSGNISCEKYDGYLFECRYSDTSEGTKRPAYISASDLATDQYIFVGSSWLTSPTARTVRYADGNLVFGIGRVNSATSNNYCIPLRIWGVKFTL